MSLSRHSRPSITALPPLATQKAGPTPLGDYWNIVSTGSGPALPEGLVATNDDRMTTVAYDPADGSLWGGLNTLVTQPGRAPHAAIAWVSVIPTWWGGILGSSHVRDGYVSASGQDVYFPGIAFTTAGNGLMTYTLSGPGYYPSTAYSLFDRNGPSGNIRVASAGQGPKDGFTEYQGYNTTSYRPRWGDYAICGGRRIDG